MAPGRGEVSLRIECGRLIASRRGYGFSTAKIGGITLVMHPDSTEEGWADRPRRGRLNFVGATVVRSDSTLIIEVC
jgi:hypothetical protein